MHSFSELIQFFFINIYSLHVWLDFLWSIITYNTIMYLLYELEGNIYMPHNHYRLWRFMITLFIFVTFFFANPLINWTVFHKLMHPTIFLVSAYYLYKWGILY